MEHEFPLIIDVGSKRGELGLASLKDRIQKVVDAFTSCRSRGLVDGRSGVIVVRLWASDARELNKHREELESCLCIIPFSRRWANLLADYVLHHITLKTLLGEEEEEGEIDAAGKESEKRDRHVDETRRVEQEQKVEGDDSESEKRRKIERSGTNLKEKVLGLVRDLGGVEPHVVAQRLGVFLPRVSEVVKGLKETGFIKVARNLPFIASLKKANAVYYLDAEKPTALHDTLMNEIWKRNMGLNGRCTDYSFECGDKTWHTDGLLENTGGCFILEVVAASEYDERVIEQLRAYSTQVGHRGIRGVVVVVLNRRCLARVRKEVADRGIGLGKGLLTNLQSKDEKLQLENLLLRGEPAVYHRNLTTS